MKIPVVTSSKRFLVIPLLALSFCGSVQPKPPSEGSAPSSRVLVVQNYYYALPGKAIDVYRWRLHASDVRAKLGLPRGRVLRRLPDSKSDQKDALPDVVWECEYSSLEAREADVALLDKSEEFTKVEKHMDTLIREFHRVVFEAGT